MSEQQKEALSALFDGETTEFETRRLLTELSADDEARWSRYQIISDSMDNKLAGSDLSINIADAVSAAIADEPLPQFDTQGNEAEQTQKTQKVAWLKPFAGFAAAASIAFVTVLGVGDFGSEQPTNDLNGFVANGNVSNSHLSLSGSQLGLNQVSGVSSRSIAAEIENIDAQKLKEKERMKYYLHQHAQHASFNNGRGLLPMARITKEEY